MTTRIADVIVPQIFTPYIQQLTMQRSALLASGAVVRDAFLDSFLAGAGLTINVPSFKDLADDEENTSSDNGAASTPKKMGTAQEIAVRLSRNQSWGTADLVSALIGTDPADAVANLVSAYWVRRLQKAFICTMQGIFADNAAAPTATEHVLNDLTFNVSGASFTAGVTNFTAEAFIDSTLTMGDAMGDLSLIAVHSVVYGRMQKNNLIEFIPDSTGMVNIPTFLGRVVIVDDGMPVTGGVFESWLFGSGAVKLGVGSPKVPTAVVRDETANNGGGQEQLINRVEWALHPTGHAYIGTSPNGGPTNANTTNNLANAGSWKRVYTERKQIKIARLITREF